MSHEYQIEIALLKFTFHKNPFEQVTINFSFIEKQKSQNAISHILQKWDYKTKKAQKISRLTELEPFRFIAFDNKDENLFDVCVQYQLKQNIMSSKVHLDIEKQIEQFQSSKEKTHELIEKNDSFQLIYKITISKNQNLNIFQSFCRGFTNQSEENSQIRQTKEKEPSPGKQQDLNNSQGLRKSSSRRPPNIQVNRIIKPPVKKEEEPLKLQKVESKILFNNFLSTGQFQSTASHLQIESPEMGSHRKSYQAASEASSDKSRVKIIGDSAELKQQIDQLTKTHHRTAVSSHEQSITISFKMKIVIIMLVVGFLFLVYDTLSDRRQTRKQHKKIKKPQKLQKTQKTQKTQKGGGKSEKEKNKSQKQSKKKKKKGKK